MAAEHKAAERTPHETAKVAGETSNLVRLLVNEAGRCKPVIPTKADMNSAFDRAKAEAAALYSEE